MFGDSKGPSEGMSSICLSAGAAFIRAGQGACTCSGRQSQEVLPTANLNLPGHTPRSLFLLFVPGGTSFCSLNNRVVVKLDMLLPARQPSLLVKQSWLPPPVIRGVLLEPLGLWAPGQPLVPRLLAL